MRALSLLVLLAAAQDPKAARSVHLGWTAPEATDFHLAMTVEESTPGSYFMACGWNTGYFGIQELAKGDKIALFSVWDPSKGDDAKAVPAEKRVEVLHQHADAKIGRFGGEGTGAQCKFPVAWKTGETCRFLVRAAVEGEKTSYSAYFRRGDAPEWTHLATFRAITKGAPLKGLYSFVEDFRRDGKSAGERRRARYSDGWVRGTKGEWSPILKGRFTADATPLETIDAAVVDGAFTLATGGDLKPSNPLKSTLALPDGPRTPPADLPPAR
ncbi:MAG: DUF3472 domain-containing protein [Planctomycetes bacterium]|nr:DUF3472 domain-containing protein [Planctomycetota bacterium]